jgi:hypothetical protein
MKLLTILNLPLGITKLKAVVLGLLHYLKVTIHFILHVVLIPILVALKALDAGIIHLIDELSKV